MKTVAWNALRFFFLLMLDDKQLTGSTNGDYCSLVVIRVKAGVPVESIGDSSGRLEQLY